MKKIYSKPEVDALDITSEGFIAYSAYGEDTPGGGSKKIRREFFDSYDEEEIEME